MALVWAFVREKNGPVDGYTFWCVGCGGHHPFYVRPFGDRHVWTFNGNIESPTFAPSLVCNKDDPPTRCHLFVRDGQIQYLADSWHGLKGTTVPMVDIP